MGRQVSGGTVLDSLIVNTIVRNLDNPLYIYNSTSHTIEETKENWNFLGITRERDPWNEEDGSHENGFTTFLAPPIVDRYGRRQAVLMSQVSYVSHLRHLFGLLITELFILLDLCYLYY